MIIEACIFLLLLSPLSKVIKVSCLVQADNKKGRASATVPQKYFKFLDWMGNKLDIYPSPWSHMPHIASLLKTL